MRGVRGTHCARPYFRVPTLFEANTQDDGQTVRTCVDPHIDTNARDNRVQTQQATTYRSGPAAGNHVSCNAITSGSFRTTYRANAALSLSFRKRPRSELQFQVMNVFGDLVHGVSLVVVAVVAAVSFTSSPFARLPSDDPAAGVKKRFIEVCRDFDGCGFFSFLPKISVFLLLANRSHADFASPQHGARERGAPLRAPRAPALPRPRVHAPGRHRGRSRDGAF